MSSRELYDRLGINKTASSAEIRSSYKTLVLKHQCAFLYLRARSVTSLLTKAPFDSPDKNPNGDSSKFQGIQEAYEVLSDETKRSTYDATGKIPGRRDSERPSAATGFKSGESADFFEQMFGGGAASSGPGRGPGSFRPSAPPRRRKAKQQTVPLDVSLEDLFLQKTFNFSVKRMILCKSCKGSGAKPSATQKQCYTCQGYGQTRSQTTVSSSVLRSQWNECQTCRGTGKRYSSADK